jgi:hypothetical protein
VKRPLRSPIACRRARIAAMGTSGAMITDRADGVLHDRCDIFHGVRAAGSLDASETACAAERRDACGPAQCPHGRPTPDSAMSGPAHLGYAGDPDPEPNSGNCVPRIPMRWPVCSTTHGDWPRRIVIRGQSARIADSARGQSRRRRSATQSECPNRRDFGSADLVRAISGGGPWRGCWLGRVTATGRNRVRREVA